MRRGAAAAGQVAGKLRRALAPPEGRAWRRLLAEAAWALPLAALLCLAGGSADPGWPEDPARLARLALIALVAPALGEELLFRVLILPPPGAPWPTWRMVLSVGLFVLWHPPQAWLFGARWAGVVLDPGFLAAVAVIGAALVRLYRRTGSIWPCVALHWTAVVGWKALLGGPSPWPA